MRSIQIPAFLVLAICLLVALSGPTAADESPGGGGTNHVLDLAILSLVFEEDRFFGSGIGTEDLESAVRRGGLPEVGRLLGREGQVGLVARSQVRIQEDVRGRMTLGQEDTLVAPGGGGKVSLMNTSTMSYTVRGVGAGGSQVEFAHDLSLEMRFQREEGESGRDRVSLNWSGAEYINRTDGVLIGRFTQISPSGRLVEYVFLARLNPAPGRSAP